MRRRGAVGRQRRRPRHRFRRWRGIRLWWLGFDVAHEAIRSKPCTVIFCLKPGSNAVDAGVTLRMSVFGV